MKNILQVMSPDCPSYNPFNQLIHFFFFVATSLQTYLRKLTMSASTPASNFYITKAGSIPRLTHDNYPIWSNSIKHALIGIEPWTIVNGTELEPDIPAGAAAAQRNRETLERY